LDRRRRLVTITSELITHAVFINKSLYYTEAGYSYKTLTLGALWNTFQGRNFVTGLVLPPADENIEKVTENIHP
jgi:hypothetical protein